MNYGSPVFPAPGRVADGGIFYLLKVLALYFDGYRQPHRAICGLDNIPVSPVPSRVLHVVKQNKLVDKIYEIKISSPWYVIGL